MRYNIILRGVGARHCRAPTGVPHGNENRYITTVPSPKVMLEIVLTAFLPGQKAKFLFEKPNAKDLLFLKELIEAGKICVVIDCTYPLQELVAAHSYSETGRTVGKIAIAVSS